MELVERLEVAGPSAIDDVMVEYYRGNLAPFTNELVGIPRLLARGHEQGMIDDLPAPIAHPLIEVALHGGIGRELPRQLPPLAAGGGDVEDGIHHAVRWRWGAKVAPARHERLDQRPFRIRQIACIAQTQPPMPRASVFSPGHRCFRRGLQTDRVIFARVCSQLMTC